MDLISLLNILFIVIYAVILGLVAPYVGVTSERYGSLVPTALGITSGSAMWILFTWLGFHYDEVWIWLIVMLGMPVAIWFGAKFIDKRREAGKSLKPEGKKKASDTADDIVILGS
jgi:threonine/homoserine/homoserine lactone efflux protein